MKQIDTIIRAEKEVDYRQRDKQLFSFYTLTLIAQENASRNLKKMLAIGLCLFSICVAFLISSITQITSDIIAYLSAIDTDAILTMTLISYAATAIIMALFKSRTTIFR